MDDEAYKFSLEKLSKDYNITGKILKVNEEYYCLDFVPNDAELIDFMLTIKSFKEFLGSDVVAP